jgi:hypothetical protein
MLIYTVLKMYGTNIRKLLLNNNFTIQETEQILEKNAKKFIKI